MEIKNIKGNLLNSQAECIIHQVNCQGKMNSGVAKTIREKWPIVYDEYYKHCQTYYKYYPADISGKGMLGDVVPVSVNDTQTVINMFSQENYGYDGKRYTSYDAIYDCLLEVNNFCITENKHTLALPYHMSCDRGGASWDVIIAMINDIFKNTDITIEIWQL